MELECLENRKLNTTIIYYYKANFGKFVTADSFENNGKGLYRTQNKFETVASLVD